ncbi:hypothetical protein [Thermus sediminis]|nr:hypothetical protein [Thermus sediminis]
MKRPFALVGPLLALALAQADLALSPLGWSSACPPEGKRPRWSG